MRALHAIEGWGVGVWSATVLRAAPPGRVERTDAGAAAVAFPWASVTKLCSSLAVLVAVEEGSVTLDEPAGPPGSTVAHLLAHASGLAPDRPAVLAAPGTRRIYSNAGFDALGRHLAQRTGVPFPDYVTEAVLEPLGMRGARWAEGRSPAHGLLGTVGDAGALAHELLRPTVVHPSTLAAATSVAFPGIRGILPGFGLQDPCDWGWGFELRDDKRPHWTGAANSRGTFGHFGRSGCFLWIDPVRQVALGVLTDRSFGAWAVDAWPALADDVLAEAEGAAASVPAPPTPAAPVPALPASSPTPGPAGVDPVGVGRPHRVQGSAGDRPPHPVEPDASAGD